MNGLELMQFRNEIQKTKDDLETARKHWAIVAESPGFSSLQRYDALKKVDVLDQRVKYLEYWLDKGQTVFKNIPADRIPY